MDGLSSSCGLRVTAVVFGVRGCCLRGTAVACVRAGMNSPIGASMADVRRAGLGDRQETSRRRASDEHRDVGAPSYCTTTRNACE